jgi:hypothetical protein
MLQRIKKQGLDIIPRILIVSSSLKEYFTSFFFFYNFITFLGA